MSNNEYTIEVGGEVVNLASAGRAQLTRLTKATKFIDLYGKTAIKSIQTREGESVDMLGLLISFLGGLDEEGLIMLGEVVSAKDKEFVEENFDLDWVVDGLGKLLQTPAFQKLRERFFGNQG